MQKSPGHGLPGHTPRHPDPGQMGARQEKSNPAVPLGGLIVAYRRPTGAFVLLLIKDVPADARKRPLASRPVWFDVSRMKEHRTLQHRRLPLIVDRFGHFPGAQPVLPPRTGCAPGKWPKRPTMSGRDRKGTRLKS